MEHKPEKGHFTRKSALSMDTMVRLLLSMSGGFLDKELEEAGVSVSVPAFSQRRSQLPFDLFENVSYSETSYHATPNLSSIEFKKTTSLISK